MWLSHEDLAPICGSSAKVVLTFLCSKLLFWISTTGVCAEEVQQRTAALEGEYGELQVYFEKAPEVCVYMTTHLWNLQ